MDNTEKKTGDFTPSLYSADLAPVPPEKRTWNTWNYTALWISMSLCIPTYMLASSLIDGGMNWWQAILTIFLGNSIVLIPMILNGHAGAKYGIPFPVFARASFGTKGANIPAMLRAIVACGWFGIQTWIGGFAVYLMAAAWIPSLENLPGIFPESFGLKTGPAISFFLFWLFNMYIVYLGVDSIKKLLVFKAYFLPLSALALLYWAVSTSNGFGPILSQPDKFNSSSEFWNYFFPALTGMVGFWATLSLNIPDFTRYAKSQKAQVIGQIIGLPPSMTLFSFIGVVVTSATVIIYGNTIWDPVILAGKFENKILVSIAMICIAISTLATNIAANIVSPANDFAHLSPSKIDFKKGGYITGVIGILIFPWKLIEDPNGYIFKWLIAYSSLLGPVGGIMIADYYFLRKKILNVNELYSVNGMYSFQNGYNKFALIALILGILPNVPGFLVTVELINKDSVWHWVSNLYNYAWFVGFGISFFVYYVLMKHSITGLLKFVGILLFYTILTHDLTKEEKSIKDYTLEKIDDYTLEIAENPNNSDLYYERGKLYKSIDMLDSAILDFSKVFDLEFDDKYFVLYLRGKCYSSKKEYSKAFSDFSNSIYYKNDFARAYLERGKLWKDLEEYKNSNDDLMMASILDDELYEAKANICENFFALGTNEFNEKNYLDAKDYFEKCSAMYFNGGEKVLYPMFYEDLQYYEALTAKEMKVYPIALLILNHIKELNVSSRYFKVCDSLIDVISKEEIIKK